MGGKRKKHPAFFLEIKLFDGNTFRKIDKFLGTDIEATEWFKRLKRKLGEEI